MKRFLAAVGQKYTYHNLNVHVLIVAFNLQ